MSEPSFRHRAMTIEALFLRARKARAEYALSLPEYTAVVKLLREEEQAIFDEAAAHNFKDKTEHNVWHRSKLKFPSQVQTEIRLLREGKDPAVSRR